MSKLSLRSVVPLVAGVFLLAGCSDSQQGTALPGPGAPSSGASASGTSAPAPGGGGTASLDPCALIGTADLAQYGKFTGPTKSDLGGGARGCGFLRERASASDERLTVSVNVRDQQSIDTVNDSGGGKINGHQGDRKAVQAPSPPNGCTLALAVGTTSRVDVAIVSTDPTKACDIASKVADIVEPKLPKA